MHTIGWVCKVPDLFPSVVFSASKHGMCECHEDRDYSKYPAEDTFKALAKE